MVAPSTFPLFLAALASLASSCSPEGAVVDTDARPSTERDAGNEPSLTADDDASSEDPAPDPIEPRCEVPHFPDDSDPVPFESLRARVVDPDGNPIAGTVAQACGINLCLNIPGGTPSDGVASIDDSQMLQLAAFKYGDGLRHAQFAVLLDAQPNHDLGDQLTVAFPALETGSPFEPGATLTSSGVELELTDDTSVELDLLSFSKEEHVFVAAEFPTNAFPAAASDQSLDALFALGPLKTKFCPPAQMRLPNTAALPSGARVEFLVHSTDIRADFAPYGQWAKVSEGEVTSDGDWIGTDEDGGVPVLGVVGVRALP